MAVPHARKYRDRQRQLTRQRWLLAGFLTVLTVLALARTKLHHIRSPDIGSSGNSAVSPVAFHPDSSLALIHKRSLQQQPPPGATLHCWRLQLLVGNATAALPEWQESRVEAAVGRVVQPLAVEWHVGDAATALAAFLGVERLPGAALIPPFCYAANCEQPEIWQTWQHGGLETSPGDALAAWVVKVSSAWLLLANEYDAAMMFGQAPPPEDITSIIHGGGSSAGGSSGEPGPDSEVTEQRTLEAGGRQWVKTPLHATWTAVLGDGTEPEEGSSEVLWRHTVRGDAIMTVRPPGVCNLFLDPGCELERPNKQFSEDTLKAREAAQQSRLDDIRNQSATIKRYTPAGFEKRKAPPALYHSLHAYFEAHAANYSRENWEQDDIFVNHDKAEFLLVDIPENGAMRPAIFDTMRPIMQQWAGGVFLQPTAIYGVRVYTRGCVLRDHVDVAETHHISAILNIEQDVEEPWPLEIFDHDGKAHQALLEPGDMLLYEGATCAHGRPTALNGRFMANVFIHFNEHGRDEQ